MQRIITIFTSSIVIGLILSLAGPMTVVAGGTFDARDLDGTYYYVTTQVREETLPGDTDPSVVYCSGYGTLTFDGVGNANGMGTDRCSLLGLSTEALNFTYVVDPDGSVIVTNTNNQMDTTHCQIVNKGRMLMCDGTEDNLYSLSFHAVGVRQ